MTARASALRGHRPVPVLDQPARDRDRRRQQQPALGRGAAQRGVDFVEGEPARVLKLVAYLRLVRPGLGEEAEHQRRRERPWLRREVAAATAAHAAFLQTLALRTKENTS